MEAALTQICGQARSTFQALEDGLRDAEAQHDATLARQQETYAQLEAAHRERWQSYESFVGGAALGIFQIDRDGRLVEANPAFAQALGYESPAAVLAAASAMDALTEPASWTHAVAAWLATGAGQRRRGHALEARRRQPSRRLRLTGRRRPQPTPGTPRIEIVAENVTAQRALEAQVRRARRWEDVARLTTGIASDLRGVVEGMSGAPGPRHRA